MTVRPHTWFFVVGVLTACSAPAGWLGVNWGDSASAAAGRLGLRCDSWEQWEGGRGYEACFDSDHPVVALGRRPLVRLFRNQERLEGLSLRFLRCGAEKDPLINDVRRQFRLGAGSDMPYTVFANGAVVHLTYDGGDDGCTLTVAGPRLGKAFADYLLEGGLRNLSHGLRKR